MTQRVGYVRTSTRAQLLDLQLAAMADAGITDVRQEQASGARDDRPVLAELLGELQEGDSLVVWRLDRLGRSMRHLLETVEGLDRRGIGFESLHDRVDTTSATGRLVFHILAALAEFERELTRERIDAGLDAARARGVALGRKPAVTPSKQRVIESLLEQGESVAEIARATGVSRATLYRRLAEWRLEVA